ncbi:hypothetical protein GCM10027174_14520 [Salinifilum aidingensis]
MRLGEAGGLGDEASGDEDLPGVADLGRCQRIQRVRRRGHRSGLGGAATCSDVVVISVLSTEHFSREGGSVRVRCFR